MERDRDRVYEQVVILRPSLGEQEIQSFVQTYTARLEQHGSALVKVDHWGKRKLAYEVKRERKGTYLCFLFLGTGNAIKPLEQANRLDDAILKFMTLRLSTLPSEDDRAREGGEGTNGLLQ